MVDQMPKEPGPHPLGQLDRVRWSMASPVWLHSHPCWKSDQERTGKWLWKLAFCHCSREDRELADHVAEFGADDFAQLGSLREDFAPDSADARAVRGGLAGLWQKGREGKGRGQGWEG